MSLAHSSTRSSAALMPPLKYWESELCKNMEMVYASFQTAHTNLNDHNKERSTWAELLNREGGKNENDEIHSNKRQTETLTMAYSQSQVDNIVSSYTQIKWVVAKQVACTRNQLVVKDIPSVVAELLDDILQRAYEKAPQEPFLSSITSLGYNSWPVTRESDWRVSRQTHCKYFSISDTSNMARESYYP